MKIATILIIASLFCWPLHAQLSERHVDYLHRQVNWPLGVRPTVAQRELGMQLLTDQRLSLTGEKSCFSCHEAKRGYTDAGPVSLGITGRNGKPLTGTRRGPSLINAAYLPQDVLQYFWDQHARGLLEQMTGPLQNPKEMGQQTVEQVAARIDAIPGYHQEFVEAFGVGANEANMRYAIAAAETQIVVNDAPIQRYLAGDKTALNREQLAGWQVFKESGCLGCHSGPDLREDAKQDAKGRWINQHVVMPHNIGVSLIAIDGTIDNGAGSTIGLGQPYAGCFKTPTLICVSLRAPYGHNGTLPSLESVVDLLDNPPAGSETTALHLSKKSKRLLVNFLKTATLGTVPKFEGVILP